MLPYFIRYNQTNYARWGTIYLNEMHQLPTEVKTEFEGRYYTPCEEAAKRDSECVIITNTLDDRMQACAE